MNINGQWPLTAALFPVVVSAYCENAPAQSADEAKFPLKAIRIIVPFPPGAGTDTLARLLGQKLTQRLGQQTIVDNRAGASGIIGIELAARSPADGYTLLLVTTGYVQIPATHELKFDP